MPPPIQNAWHYPWLRCHQHNWMALADNWRLYRGNGRDAYETWNDSNVTWDFSGPVRFLDSVTFDTGVVSGITGQSLSTGQGPAVGPVAMVTYETVANESSDRDFTMDIDMEGGGLDRHYVL